MKNRVHIAPNYFFNPTHPITIALIGVGGTGSIMLARLARMDYALRQIGHAGLQVKAFDEDSIESMNIGRQSFTPSDLGDNKVINSLTKINHSFNLQWEGIPFNAKPHGNDIKANIIITCVDNAKYRLNLSKNLKYPHTGHDYNTMYYWMDIGNSRDKGQFIIGSLFKEERVLGNEVLEPVQNLKTIIELFPTLGEQDTEEIQGKGCAYIDKLNEQSLFINDALAAHAGDCLFRLLLKKELYVHGGFVNLDNGMVNSIKV